MSVVGGYEIRLPPHFHKTPASLRSGQIRFASLWRF
jgi:hypothetical protein